jgi:hypothetical protein
MLRERSSKRGAGLREQGAELKLSLIWAREPIHAKVSVLVEPTPFNGVDSTKTNTLECLLVSVFVVI